MILGCALTLFRPACVWHFVTNSSEVSGSFLQFFFFFFLFMGEFGLQCK